MTPKRTRDKADEPAFDEKYPKQINGRVTLDTYDRLEALRDTLGSKIPTGELLTRGIEALIKQLGAEDRKYFDASLGRIRRRRHADE